MSSIHKGSIRAYSGVFGRVAFSKLLTPLFDVR